MSDDATTPSHHSTPEHPAVPVTPTEPTAESTALPNTESTDYSAMYSDAPSPWSRGEHAYGENTYRESTYSDPSHAAAPYAGPTFAGYDYAGAQAPASGPATGFYAPTALATATHPGTGPAAAPAKPSRWRASLAATAVVAALVGGGAGATTVALTRSSASSSIASGVTVTTATAQNSAAVTDGTVSSAAAKITPSVVTIQVTGSSESGTGSGVIIRSDGYVLTNDHVVSVAANGGTITVETSDGRTAAATVVGRDSTDDLAVIKVTGLTNLTAATFAKSSSVTVGQTVVAVGAPLGLSDTVTSGIVSAKARTVRSGDDDNAVFAAIQTDAAINPGNSGGALVDLNGNVIGINAAIASTSSSGVTVPGQQTTQSGSIGIGFAIPSDEASRVAAELIATGKASHAVLGVSVQSSTSSSSTTSGAVLSAVTAGGAAASAGLQTGDVVTAVDSTRIEEGDDLIAAIRAHAVKDTVTITYTRNGTSHTAKATLTAGT